MSKKVKISIEKCSSFNAEMSRSDGSFIRIT